MKKNIIILLFLSTIYSSSKACCTYLNNVAILSYLNDTFQLKVTTDFTLGSGSTCPHISFFTFSQIGDSVRLNVYYNTEGPYPAMGCTSTDIISVGKITSANTIHTYAYSFGNNDTSIGYNDKIIPTTSILPSSVLLLKVTPNPVVDELTIENGRNTKVQIFDIAGRLIYKNVINHDKEFINTTLWEAGLYTVELTDNSGHRVNRKIIRQAR